MDAQSGNTAWRNPECWYGEDISLPPDADNSLSILSPNPIDLSLFGQCPTGLFEVSSANAPGTRCTEPNMDALQSLLAASTDSATANYHRQICGNVGDDLDRSAHSVPAAPRDRSRVKARRSRRKNVSKSKSGNQRLQCGWNNCDYNGTFGRKAELMRHIDSKHVSPGAHMCPMPNCGRAFNRKDNLDEHLRVHLRN
ncbi:predicted protein [Aspergillus terreus NIH2624]|uniref:C2H2-type domain-containing protein n=1 Tax=Aspergillus terreus (strain NIH 2624 / FGSC A1156) TaxID=341663 RepID=Q0CCV4_ASPTN|nr:uncharacterized protein ATEG_08480 [Aspergillus terreus NIH2624]EAU31653.1 predicted protein [Aspergillus terreus NIH2624]